VHIIYVFSELVPTLVWSYSFASIHTLVYAGYYNAEKSSWSVQTPCKLGNKSYWLCLVGFFFNNNALLPFVDTCSAVMKFFKLK
jgi:hypothetical protein